MNVFDGHNYYCFKFQLYVIDSLFAAEDFFYTEADAKAWCKKNADPLNGIFSGYHKLSPEEKQYLEKYSL